MLTPQLSARKRLPLAAHYLRTTGTRFLLAISVASSTVCAGSATTSDASGSEDFNAPARPQYAEILQREWSDEPDWDRFSSETGWRHGRFVRSDPRRIAFRAREAWEAYELTGNARYARTAKDLVTRLGTLWAEDPSTIPSRCMFTQRPLLVAVEGLVKSSTLPENVLKGIQRFNQGVAWRQLGTDNQALARQAGVATALSLFPEDPKAADWKQYLDDGWKEILQLEDFDENATGYAGIGLRSTIEIARLQGLTEDLQKPGIRRAMERARDTLSPSGSLPEVGDNYFSDGLDTNWLMVFETAARLYDDPSFLTAAWKLFWRGAGNPPGLRGGEMISDSNIEWLLSLEEIDAAPAPIDAGSVVTLRNTPDGEDVPDKMVLGPDRNPGSPFALLDLYSDGYHAHQNRHGAVLFYEANGIPFLHGLSRHATGAEHSNQVLIRPADEPFPDGPPLVRDQWRTAAFPARLVGEADSTDPKLRTLDNATFRVDPVGSEGLEILIDNVRLTGPAGVRVLESFESEVAGFTKAPGRTEGEFAAKIAPDGSNRIFWHLRFKEPVHFDPKEYFSLEFDWMYRAKNDQPFSFTFRVPGIHNGPPAFLNAAPRREAFAVSQTGRDSYGVLEFSDYMTHGTKLRREILLLGEGPMLVRDTLVPAASAGGMRGGPIWHLNGLSEKGENWFLSADDDRDWVFPDAGRPPFPRQSLLVVFSKSPGREFAVTGRQVEGRHVETAFATEILAAAKPVRFVTVLLPYDHAQSHAEFIQQIDLQAGEPGGSTTIRMPLREGNKEIEWLPDGTFSTKITPKPPTPTE